MNAAAIAARLWPHLVRILRAIGRWVLGQVREHGAQVVGHYMIARIGVFKDSRARAIKMGWKRRARWLQGRISRWLQAGQWLVKNAKKINPKVADAFEALALGERIPVNSPLEKLR